MRAAERREEKERGLASARKKDDEERARQREKVIRGLMGREETVAS